MFLAGPKAKNQTQPIKSSTPEKTVQNKALSQSPAIYRYFDFPIPMKLDDKAVSDSLSNGKQISFTQTAVCEQTYTLADTEGWKIVDDQEINEGKSFSVKFFKSKDHPGIELVCQQDSKTDTYDQVSVNFINTKKVGSWLLAIKKSGSEILKDYNIEDLMGCNGKIIETAPETTECIIKE